MDAKPKRRWYQFSLRTMFVLVTLVCVGFGYWVHWSKEWIRQRHSLISNGEVFVNYGTFPERELTPLPRQAPCGLWLFGEKGVAEVILNSADFETACRLFPEAYTAPPVPYGTSY